jgi:putative ABC transport system permease protein
VRRIGLRNAVRRPREAALVMLGCILGTALIVGNGSVGDSFTYSLTTRALSDFGPLDAIVRYDNRDDWSAANAHISQALRKNVTAATAVTVMNAPVRAGGTKTAPRANLIEADYRRAGGLTAGPGMEPGTGPAAGQAWVSRRLASRLALRVGDTVTVHAPTKVQLRVARIESSALVSFLDNNVKSGESLLVGPGTVLNQHTKHPDLVHPDWFTLVIGAHPSTGVPDPKDVAALDEALTKTVTPFDGEVTMVRDEALHSAINEGKQTATLLTTIGSFGIIAGILLLINVLLMLAEERLAELGTMRAVGMPRSPLIGSFSLEGGIYAAVGSLLGGGAGVLLGRLLVTLMDRQTSQSELDYRGLPLHFSIDTATLTTGIATGFLVSVIAVVATSFRVSRMEVIRSLRALPPQRRGQRRGAVPLSIIGLIAGPLLTLIGYTTPASFPFLIGPVITALCAGVLLTRRFGWEPAVLATCAPLLCFTIPFGAIDPTPQRGPTFAVMGGVVSVGASVLLVNAVQTRLGQFLRGLGRGRSVVPLRLGLANPVAHRVRMLLTVLPFALVIFTLTYAEGLSHLVSTELNATTPILGGGFTVYADSNPVAPFDFARYRSSDVTHVAPIGTLFASFTFDPEKPNRFWEVTGFDRRLYTNVEPPPLLARAPQYKTDREAYEAVFNDPDLMLSSDGFLMAGNFGPSSDDPVEPPGVGDSFVMRDPVSDRTHDVTLVGLTYADVLGTGAFLGAPGLREVFGDRFVMSDAMISATDSTAVIDDLQRAGVDQGVRAVDIEETARIDFKSLTGLINLFRSDLGIGVIVGVAGIGVVLVRSVRDRRQQIGVLRAMGVDAGEIGSSFMIEGAFVSAQGLLVGVGVGVLTIAALTGSQLVYNLLGFSPPMRPPPVTILILLVGLFLASLAASALPARRAAKIPPAIALRLVD